MKILFANNHLYIRGGCERVMFDESGWMAEHGHEVFAFGGYHENASTLPHSDLFPPSSNFAATGAVERAKLALRVVYNRDTGRRFESYCTHVSPTIVHFHNIYAGLTTAIIDSCLRRGIPSILTLHDYKLSCPCYVMLRQGQVCARCAGRAFYHCVLGRCHKGSVGTSLVSAIESYFNQILRKYLKADLLIAPSQFLLDRMVEAGVPRSKLRLVANGIDTASVRPVYADAGYGLYLGRLSPEKGLKTLLRAAEHAPVPLKIAGDGPQYARLAAVAQDSGLTHVSFVGHKSGSELAALIQSAAFLIVPSEWFENAPMSILEGMAYGKPVVASRIGGIPELIEHRRTGFLFEPGDANGLAEKMRQLADAPTLRREMGIAARQRVEKYFSLETHCRMLLNIYDEALARKSVRPSCHPTSSS
jgi:glycosyltransferase involved in cell wall biosynthesis